jgi:hypothetical protein
LELIAENMAIWKKIPSKSGEFGPFFSHGKSVVKVEIIFLRSKFGEIWLKKTCDNHFGYKQKSLTKHWHAGPCCDPPLAGGEGG